MIILTEDLVQLFQMLDTDRNGEVDPEEFIEVYAYNIYISIYLHM